MTYKHLLVHVDAGKRSPERIRLAVSLARGWGAHLTGLFADAGGSRGLVAPGSFGRSVVSSRSPRQFRKTAAAAEEAFGSIARAAGIEPEWWQLGPSADVADVAAEYCRYVDLAVLGQPDPAEERVPEDFASQVLLQAGRPVLLVPSAGQFEQVGRRVLVAWNRSREGTRALHDALPFLQGAEKVLVVAFLAPYGGPSAEGARPNVVRHLQSHGVAADYHPAYVKDGAVGRNGVDVFTTLLNLSSDFGADLVVMGGRGRAGFPFPRASSSTRRSLQSMTAPVLLSA